MLLVLVLVLLLGVVVVGLLLMEVVEVVHLPLQVPWDSQQGQQQHVRKM
jgi:hypothetical protein